MMENVFTYAAACLTGYLFGSVPFAYVLARRRLGIDIREHGSGNVGATNLWRVGGSRLGGLCFALDVFKGFLPVVILQYAAFERAAIAAAVCAVIGHVYPVWLKGSGGKGVATATGAFLALAPAPLFYAVLIFFVVGPLATRTVSAGSVTAAAVLILLSWGYASRDVAVVATLVGILTIVRHRSNLKRLYHGTESRIWGGMSFPGEDNTGPPADKPGATVETKGGE